MSQRSVEKLLGRILTDDDFRRSFFPIRSSSFEIAAGHGFDLTPIERSALSSLRLRGFECLAQSIDARISRSSASEVPLPIGETDAPSSVPAVGQRPTRANNAERRESRQ